MPTYEYKCNNCGHTFDVLQSMKEEKLKKCPECGEDTLQRLIGSGAGLIFKGSGFYLTDYAKKDSGASNSVKKDVKKDTTTKESSEAKTEKTETSKEQTPAPKTADSKDKKE
ncbi:MAG: zinc ribbon domain-containing protein [Ignavibacteria bacterium]|nr:zinc ribbon domain-containing protein [Ignavibacteria bacterium]